MSQNLTLGKGLGALIPNKRTAAAPLNSPSSSNTDATQEVLKVPVSAIRANPHQPRKRFTAGALSDLVASIKAHGILQPLIVMEVRGGYELVAGERRLRAAKEAGLKTVPVLVRNAGELEQFELSLIENLQREDLNPLERAEAYRKLVDEYGLTHEEAARRLAVSRSALTNTLRLLTLPADIQAAVASGKISEGQAKVLLELRSESAQHALFEKIITQGLTVEETRREVKKISPHGARQTRGGAPSMYISIAEKISRALGTKVRIMPKGKGGVVEIEYYAEEELQSLLARLKS